MIPVRDVIPTRTRPGATLALLAGAAAALVWCGVSQWWLPWCLHLAVLWLFGSTVEDRLGHIRVLVLVFTSIAASAAAATRSLAPVVPAAVAGGAAGVAAAYFLMFPRSRVVTIVPVVVGIELADVPAWVIIALWGLVQVVAGSPPAACPGTLAPLASLGPIVAGALAGSLAWLLLRRPERMGVDWWDPPRGNPESRVPNPEPRTPRIR